MKITRNMKLLLLCASLILPVLAWADSPLVTVDSANQTPVPVVGSGLGFNGTPIPVIPYAGTPAAAATPIKTEVTPIAQTIMLPTQVPTLFPVTPNAMAASGAAKTICISNQFNIDMICSYGAPAATPLPFRVPAGTINCDPFYRDGVQMSGGVSCTRDANVTPSAGTLTTWGYK